MKKIVHIINNLQSGGAENMLYKIIKYSDKDKYYHEVISLKSGGAIEEKIKKTGTVIHHLNIKKSNLIKSILKAKKIIDNFDVVDTWLYHSDFFGFITGKLAKKKIIWNIRHCNIDKNLNKKGTMLILKINSYLSKHIDCITFNSAKALENHKHIGFCSQHSKIVYNGFDIEVFKKTKEAKHDIIKSLNLNISNTVLITIGRWDIQKDYYTLINCLHLLKMKKIKFKMIMVGCGLDYKNNVLVELIDQYDLKSEIILFGERADIPQLLSAADIYVSSSAGESFSNTIGEAMACELTCVVTDVGHSKFLVGDLGKVVKPKDPSGLKDAIVEIINTFDLKIKGEKSRERIAQNYNIKKIVKIYEETYEM